MSPNLVDPNGKPLGGRSVTYREWIGGENAKRYATREEVVSFHNLSLREQIVPLIKNAIQRYDAERRANRWYRRLLRWLWKPWRPKKVTLKETHLTWPVPLPDSGAAALEVERRSMAALDDLTGTRFPESEAPRDG